MFKKQRKGRKRKKGKIIIGEGFVTAREESDKQTNERGEEKRGTSGFIPISIGLIDYIGIKILITLVTAHQKIMKPKQFLYIYLLP